MRKNAKNGCLCVESGAVEARVVEEQGCVCGCFQTTVSRYPALFSGMTFSKEDVARIKDAGQPEPT